MHTTGTRADTMFDLGKSSDQKLHHVLYSILTIFDYILTLKAFKPFKILLFRCHIDAAKQQRALNFELVVSD